jgi:L-2-hydroxyglutarate oxidase
VVATDESEVPRLDELHRRAIANQVPGARMIEVEELREIEPHAAGIKAMQVASTGIIDYVAVARRYAAIVRERGGNIRVGARVQRIRRSDGGYVLETTAGEVRAGHIINCGGLHADVIARFAGCRPPARIIPFRGEYYKLVPTRTDLVRSLIYPVPDPTFPFLGVHFTRMIGGGVEAGPNAVMSLKREGYSRMDFSLRDTWRTLSYPGFWRLSAKYWRTGLGEIHRSLSKGAFVRALQRLLPDLRDQDLAIGGAGVRAQAVAPDGALLDDFAIETMEEIVHVLNAPSPAATASIPIGRSIAERAREHFNL